MNKLLQKPSEGDWVRGISLNGELFRGYVEAVEKTGDAVYVKVTDSDNEQAIGRTVISRQAQVQVLPLTIPREEGHLLNWIDQALMLRDEQWFMELTEQLIELRAQRKRNQ